MERPVASKLDLVLYSQTPTTTRQGDVLPARTSHPVVSFEFDSEGAVNAVVLSTGQIVDLTGQKEVQHTDNVDGLENLREQPIEEYRDLIPYLGGYQKAETLIGKQASPESPIEVLRELAIALYYHEFTPFYIYETDAFRVKAVELPFTSLPVSNEG